MNPSRSSCLIIQWTLGGIDLRFGEAGVDRAGHDDVVFVKRLLEGATMHVRYRVTLTASERAQLATFVLGGKGAYRRLKRAQVLLAGDRGSSVTEHA